MWGAWIETIKSSVKIWKPHCRPPARGRGLKLVREYTAEFAAGRSFEFLRRNPQLDRIVGRMYQILLGAQIPLCRLDGRTQPNSINNLGAVAGYFSDASQGYKTRGFVRVP